MAIEISCEVVSVKVDPLMWPCFIRAIVPRGIKLRRTVGF